MWPCGVEAGQHSRDCGHFQPSGIEPWETDRNVTVAAQARKTLLSPLQKIRTTATQDGLGQHVKAHKDSGDKNDQCFCCRYYRCLLCIGVSPTTPHSYVEVLTHTASECDLIWK